MADDREYLERLLKQHAASAKKIGRRIERAYSGSASDAPSFAKLSSMKEDLAYSGRAMSEIRGKLAKLGSSLLSPAALEETVVGRVVQGVQRDKFMEEARDEASPRPKRRSPPIRTKA